MRHKACASGSASAGALTSPWSGVVPSRTAPPQSPRIAGFSGLRVPAPFECRFAPLLCGPRLHASFTGETGSAIRRSRESLLMPGFDPAIPARARDHARPAVVELFGGGLEMVHSLGWPAGPKQGFAQHQAAVAFARVGRHHKLQRIDGCRELAEFQMTRAEKEAGRH